MRPNLSVKEAARSIGLSLSTFNQLIASRELPSLKIGKRRLIEQSALDAFLASKRVTQENAKAPASESNDISETVNADG